jgi:hypothetical protein
VISRITLRNLDHAKTVSAQALDGSGEPTGEPIRAEKKAEGWDIDLGRIVTTWYEVVVTR